MERTAKISDKGKGQASSKLKAVDVVKRSAQIAEQSHRGNKLQADQKSISSQDSALNPKESKIKPQKHSASRYRDSNLQVRLALSQRQGGRIAPKLAERPFNAGPQSLRRKQGSYDVSNLGKRPFNASRQKEIPVLAGGGGPGESSSQQLSDKERASKLAQEAKDPTHPINRATDYLNGLSLSDYSTFNAHKHGFTTDEGKKIAEEHTRILNSPWPPSSKNAS